MGMDVDCVVAKHVIDQLYDLLISLPHGERSDICDDYVHVLKALLVQYHVSHGYAAFHVEPIRKAQGWKDR